jgi:hypothetical protein
MNSLKLVRAKGLITVLVRKDANEKFTLIREGCGTGFGAVQKPLLSETIHPAKKRSPFPQ